MTSPDSGTEHGSSPRNRIRLKDPHSGSVRPRYGKVSARILPVAKHTARTEPRNLASSGVMNFVVGLPTLGKKPYL